MKILLNVILVLAIFMSSCNTAKKAAKFNDAVEKYVREHPSKCDTVASVTTEEEPIFIEPEIPEDDTNAIKKEVEKIIVNVPGDCRADVTAAFNRGIAFQKGIKIPPVECPPSTHTVQTVQNKDREQNLERELNKQLGKNEQLATESKGKNKWMWMFFGLLGINIILIALKFKNGVSKKIPVA